MTTKEHTDIWNAAVNNTVKCVLEIIDRQYKSTCDRYTKVGYMEAARDELRQFRAAVMDLKQEEKK